MTDNGEQTVMAKIAVTRETGGKKPAFAYVIQLIDDASGLLIGEARMDGDTFAKVFTGHITTVPVRIEGPAARQHLGLTESTIKVSGLQRSSLVGEAWLNAAREALTASNKPPHDVRMSQERGVGLVVTFCWWTPERFTSEEIATLKSCIPAIPVELAKAEQR